MSERKSASTFLKMGQLVKETGVSDQAIRYYEKLGLIESTRRTRGGFRLFESGVLQRLRAIRALQDYGFSLEEVGSLLRGAEREDHACDFLKGLFKDKVHRLHQEIATLRRRASRVESMLRHCSTCIDHCKWHHILELDEGHP